MYNIYVCVCVCLNEYVFVSGESCTNVNDSVE